MDPEVSLASVAENAVSSLPSCAMNEVSVVSMSPLPVNRQLDYGGTPPPSGKASGISMLEEVLFDYVANSIDSQPKAVSCATRSTTAQGVSSGGARGCCVLQSKARRGHSRNMQPNARPFSTRKTSAGQLFSYARREPVTLSTRPRHCHRLVAASTCCALAWIACSPEDNCPVCPTIFKTIFKPLPDNHITKKPSRIHGWGLFLKAKRPRGIEKETVIALMQGKNIGENPSKTTEFTIKVGRHYIEPTGPVRFVNHSCRPNQ